MALTGLEHHCTQNTHGNVAVAVTNLSRFTCDGFSNFTEQGSREHSSCEAVCSLNAPACLFSAIYLSNNKTGLFYVKYLYLTTPILSKYSVCVSDTRLAIWISLCITAPWFRLPPAEWKPLQGWILTTLMAVSVCLNHHTLLWRGFPPKHTRLMKMTCFIVGGKLHWKHSSAHHVATDGGFRFIVDGVVKQKSVLCIWLLVSCEAAATT